MDKSLVRISIICCVILISIVGAFKFNYDKVHQLILNNEVEQLAFTTRYLTRLLESKIENQVDQLTSKAKVFTYYDRQDITGVVQRLQAYGEEMNYHLMGLMDLSGKTIDSTGEEYTVSDSELLTTLMQGNHYISNALDDLDCMVLAVPISDGNHVVGILWGHYSVENLADTIEVDDQAYRYFQIIDDSGNYIVDSNNQYSLQVGENVWDELSCYDLSDGVSIDTIRNTIANNQTGQFHFKYNGEGRYVYYQPLGNSSLVCVFSDA